MAAAVVMKTLYGALGDISAPDEPPWDGNLADAPIDYARAKISHVDVDGVIHHVPADDDGGPPPQPEPQTKKKRRRRSTPAIEAAIAETGAEREVDNELVYAVERAVPTMTLSEARTRREVAEGGLRRAQYDLLKKRVVRVDAIQAALTANFNGIRTNVLSVASKVAPRVALLTDAKAIERLCRKSWS